MSSGAVSAAASTVLCSFSVFSGEEGWKLKVPSLMRTSWMLLYSGPEPPSPISLAQDCSSVS